MSPRCGYNGYAPKWLLGCLPGSLRVRERAGIPGARGGPADRRTPSHLWQPAWTVGDLERRQRVRLRRAGVEHPVDRRHLDDRVGIDADDAPDERARVRRARSGGRKDRALLRALTEVERRLSRRGLLLQRPLQVRSIFACADTSSASAWLRSMRRRRRRRSPCHRGRPPRPRETSASPCGTSVLRRNRHGRLADLTGLIKSQSRRRRGMRQLAAGSGFARPA